MRVYVCACVYARARFVLCRGVGVFRVVRVCARVCAGACVCARGCVGAVCARARAVHCEV